MAISGEEQDLQLAKSKLNLSAPPAMHRCYCLGTWRISRSISGSRSTPWRALRYETCSGVILSGAPSWRCCKVTPISRKIHSLCDFCESQAVQEQQSSHLSDRTIDSIIEMLSGLAGGFKISKLKSNINSEVGLLMDTNNNIRALLPLRKHFARVWRCQ